MNAVSIENTVPHDPIKAVRPERTVMPTEQLESLESIESPFESRESYKKLMGGLASLVVKLPDGRVSYPCFPIGRESINYKPHPEVPDHPSGAIYSFPDAVIIPVLLSQKKDEVYN